MRMLRLRLVVPVVRSTHSPEYTARGVANGVFWGLTPTVGLQTLEIMATWVVGRRVFGTDSSLLQAFIWAWVNNPVTMIPLYYASYVTGLWMIGQGEQAQGYQAFGDLWTLSAQAGWFDRFTIILKAIGVPLFVGGLPYALLGSSLGYYWALRVVRRRQRRVRSAG